MSLDEPVQQIIQGTGSVEAAKAVLFADVSDIEQAAAHHSVEADYLIESALEMASSHLNDASDLITRVQNYWLQCDNLAGAVPYEVIVRAAEFLATGSQTHPLSDSALWELAQSSDWRNRVVAGWVTRDRTDAVAKDIAKTLATDTFTDDNGFSLVREAVGVYD